MPYAVVYALLEFLYTDSVDLARLIEARVSDKDNPPTAWKDGGSFSAEAGESSHPWAVVPLGDTEHALVYHLLRVAQEYDLGRLSELCEHQLQEAVSLHSVSRMFAEADRYHHRNLRQYCLNWILDNLQEVELTPEFEALHSMLIEEVYHFQKPPEELWSRKQRRVNGLNEDLVPDFNLFKSLSVRGRMSMEAVGERIEGHLTRDLMAGVPKVAADLAYESGVRVKLPLLVEGIFRSFHINGQGAAVDGVERDQRGEGPSDSWWTMTAAKKSREDTPTINFYEYAQCISLIRRGTHLDKLKVGYSSCAVMLSSQRSLSRHTVSSHCLITLSHHTVSSHCLIRCVLTARTLTATTP
jgi:hypothetical protein